MLTACIGGAIFASDERRLFQSVCDILVRSGLFQLAWFGYAAPNSGIVKEPLACSTNADGVIEALKLALSQDDGHLDPSSVCIRRGQAYWNKYLADAQDIGPVRSLGYTSVIALPVVSNDGTQGALSLYYDDPEAYGSGAVDLLKEQLEQLQVAFAGRPPNPRPRSEELEIELRKLIDVLPDHVALVDAGGMLLHLNRASIEYHGYSVEDLQGGAHVFINHPNDVERLLLRRTAGFASGASFEYEQRLLRKDSQYRWFLGRATPIRDADGQIIRWCVSATDIEERKQAEEKIRQSEADLLEAQRISHTGSWKHDLKADVVTITPEMARMFGLAENETSITPEVFFRRLHPEDRSRQAASYQEAIQARADFESDYRIVLLDGSLMHVHNLGHPKFNESGELAGFVGTVLDVTAAKQAEDKIRQSEKEARQILDLPRCTSPNLGPIWPVCTPIGLRLIITESLRKSGERQRYNNCCIHRKPVSLWMNFPGNSKADCHLSTKRGSGEATDSTGGFTIA